MISYYIFNTACTIIATRAEKTGMGVQKKYFYHSIENARDLYGAAALFDNLQSKVSSTNHNMIGASNIFCALINKVFKVLFCEMDPFKRSM